MFVHQRLTLQLAHISRWAVSASVAAAAALGVDSEILPSIRGGWQSNGSERRGNTCLLVATDFGVVKESRLGRSRHQKLAADILKIVGRTQDHVICLQPDLKDAVLFGAPPTGLK